MKAKSRMELGDITHHNLKQLKRLNQVVFPVSYNEKFYKDVLDAGDLAKLVYYNDIVVGAVCCRIDPGVGDFCKKRLYIMTLGCLAPYRRLGLGTLMLQNVFELCRKDPAISSIFLHVQVSNEDALSFYRRFGFKAVQRMVGYYKRIEPADAFVLERKLDEDPIPPTSIVEPCQQNGSAGGKCCDRAHLDPPIQLSHDVACGMSEQESTAEGDDCVRGQKASTSASGAALNGKFSASLSKLVQPGISDKIISNTATAVPVVNGTDGHPSDDALSNTGLSNGALSPKQSTGIDRQQPGNAGGERHVAGKGRRKAKK